MPSKVKICGLTRWTDVSASLDLGAAYIGLNVYPQSPRSAGRDQAFDLCQRIPAGQRVMVDVNTAAHELENWADLGFDFFQIHFDYSVDWATIASWSGAVGRERLWLAPKIPPGEPFPQNILEFADTVLVDAYDPNKFGGSGKTGDWSKFAEWSTLYAHKQFILAGGLNPENVAEAVAQSGAEIVDTASGVESQPGKKDPAKLKAFFEALGYA